MPLAPGARLGPYEIVAPIGAGGMGEVFRARDTRLDRNVAIKVLPQALAVDPQLRDRFEREARAISSLNHPHICTLFDVGHQDPSAGSGGAAVDLLVLGVSRRGDHRRAPLRCLGYRVELGLSPEGSPA
jgi:serine/threonine protein kinase